MDPDFRVIATRSFQREGRKSIRAAHMLAKGVNAGTENVAISVQFTADAPVLLQLIACATQSKRGARNVFASLPG